MERAVEGGPAPAYPEFGFSAGGRGADFGLAAAPRGGKERARFFAPLCRRMARIFFSCCIASLPFANKAAVEMGWWRGERMGIGGGGTKTAVDGPPIVSDAHGWSGLGPGPPRRAWAIGGGDASPASVRLRERGAPVAATPSCCGTGSTAGDDTSTHMASVSPPVSATGGSPGAGVAVEAPSDGTDGGTPCVVELVDLDAATAARAA